MRRLLLSTAAAIILAGPALAETKSLSVNLSGIVRAAPKGGGTSTIVNFGASGVNLIAVGNRVDFLVVATHTLFSPCNVTVPLAIIPDMVFTTPSFLTVQGGGLFAVTISYMGGCPPVVGSPVSL